MKKFPDAAHWADDDPAFGYLGELAGHVSLAPLHDVLKNTVSVATTLVKCDSCFVYVREGDELVLRASRNPHPEMVDRLTLKVGEGITGWVAQHHEPVAIALNAWKDPRFKLFNELPEDKFESFLSVPLVSRTRVVGVINLQSRKPRHYSVREVSLIATIGALVGAEIEMARLEGENAALAGRLETEMVVARAKGILQRSLGISDAGAGLILEQESRRTGKPLKEVAETVVGGGEPRAAP